MPHSLINCDLYLKSPFCIHLLLTEPYLYVSCPMFYMLMLLMGCVFFPESGGRNRVEISVLIGGWKSCQCSQNSLKVISSHKMKCSLVSFFFINQADRIGLGNQIKNCVEVLLPVALLDALFKCNKSLQKAFYTAAILIQNNN